jgi:hypothetical protein
MDDAKSEMMRAHEAMATVLDAKFSNLPEWKAFRAIDRALLALEAVKAVAPQVTVKRSLPRVVLHEPYVSLTLKAMEQGNQPVTTPKLMEFIGQHRPLGDDLARAKINVTSSLSKDKRIKSVPWEGGSAWWYADRPVPKKGATT